MSGAERQRRWLAKNRAAFNLRRRNARKGLSLVEKQPVVETTVSRTEMSSQENPVQVAEPFDRASAAHAIPEGRTVGSNPATGATKEEILSKLREMVKVEQEKPATEVPESTDTRSRSDIAMGIWRNDQGGVISKFAWDKLQKLKEHAKENNFHVDEYSQ